LGQEKQRGADEKQTLISHHAERVRVMVVVPLMREGRDSVKSLAASRSDQARFEEACGLARAIDVDIVESRMLSVQAPRPATLITSGKVDELRQKIEQEHVDLVIVDHPLTPVQQRNLEKIWGAKVIDRTGLILEIFGRRAQTKEGVLQVELAHLTYQKGRLVRSWTHLERQRGGSGFLGGPGETQIEADRRVLQSKINKLQRELEKVSKTRKLHRAQRQKTPAPVVALVGYTNAGKSSLFNALTGATVEAKDMLFATLDPTLRRVILPHGGTIILSDTVGFISNLPTHLVAAFRATLEEVLEADLILHVRDMSNPDSQAQAQDVIEILDQLGVKQSPTQGMIEVWNKIDLLNEAEKNQLEFQGTRGGTPTYLVSTVTGEGLQPLRLAIEHHIMGALKPRHITLEPHEMALMDWLYRHAGGAGEGSPSINRRDCEDGAIELEFTLNDEDWGRFISMRSTFSNRPNGFSTL